MVSLVILTQDPISEDLQYDLDRQTYRDFEVIMATEDGAANALNIALAKAKGEIFVRIDDDVRLPNNWLEEIVKGFENNIVIAGVTGPTFVPIYLRNERDSIRVAQDPPWWLRWLWDNDPYAPAKIYNCGSVSYGSNFIEHIEDKEYEIDHLEGTNWAMRTGLIRCVGGFDPLFDGVWEWLDDDVCFKIKKLGYAIKYNPKAGVFHMLGKGKHFNDRFEGWGRIKNWLRFHFRHSKFHYKKVIWLMFMITYMLKKQWSR